MRVACVSLPALPLQLLMRRHPDWRDAPAAVVADDRPQGQILHTNRAAREQRVLPGMSYAAGLSLAPGLRARVVPPEEVATAVQGLVERLRTYSPLVEPAADEPGVFWVDAGGLERLHPSLEGWARAIHIELRGDELWPRVVVGWSRFGTYALARGGSGEVQIYGSEAMESEAAACVPLARLQLSPKVRDALDKLAVRNVGDLLQLPADGVRRRFGEEALRVWRLAAGDWRPGLRAQVEVAPLRRVLHLDHPMRNATRLLFMVKRMLPGLLATLAERHQVLATLELELRLEGGEVLSERLQPAAPTLDERMLLDLVRLRLDAMTLRAVVEDLALDCEGIAATTEQLRLYFERAKRDLRAADQAVARVRAEFGADSVVQACPGQGHLPEARFAWRPLESVRLPRPKEARQRTLVRRIRARPERLPPQPRHVRDEGWLVRGLAHGSAVRSWGPFVLSGGWWAREVHREYQFTELQRGDLLWIYYDRVRRRWFLQGEVG